MEDDKFTALQKWMIAQGCKVHPNIQVPKRIEGVLGIGTTGPLPHKTLILAIPSSLILTTTKCYNDPALHRLFLKNDDLFDYQASQDAQFNVLCVFMMYHRIYSTVSPWKQYFEAMSDPETAVDWTNQQLAGLNRSLIQEVVHVRRECVKLQQELVQYLLNRKQFEGISQKQLRNHFNFCYRSVMTRSFGYYFSQTCLIPIADLVNHGCQSVDHQLMNVNFESDKQFQQGYFPRCEKIDCSLLNLKKPQKQSLPFRQRFLVQNKIVENRSQALQSLDRQTIDKYLQDWNRKRLDQGEKLQDLHFCSQDEEQDNDTDQEFEVQKKRQMENCHKNEEEQMQLFMKHYVSVERYEDVERKLNELNDKSGQQEQKQQFTIESNNINSWIAKEEDKSDIQNEQIKQNLEETISLQKDGNQSQETDYHAESQTKTGQQISNQEQTKLKEPDTKERQNPFSNTGGRGVPIQLVPSDSEQEQDEEEDEWGLKEGSYFTMSTSSPVGAGKQLFNSYGSRTNKFLLIWYGFAYPDNLYDSVTFRLHVQFGSLRPAREIVLDTYVGGQGLSFRKNDQQIVHETEVSREFRLKRSNICQNLLIFLRLFLMNYYKGEDLYKLFVTFPASVDFELFVCHYLRDIIVCLYDRYPEEVIQKLKNQMEMTQFSNIRHKIYYKVVYLTEQRKLLDINIKAVDGIIKVLEKCKLNGGILKRDMYQTLPIQVIRVIKKYLILYEKQAVYIAYQQIRKQEEKENGIEEKESPGQKQKLCNNKNQQQQTEEQWEDIQGEENEEDQRAQIKQEKKR